MKQFPEGLQEILIYLKSVKISDKLVITSMPDHNPIEEYLNGMKDEEKEEYLMKARFCGYLNYMRRLNRQGEGIGAFMVQITEYGEMYINKFLSVENTKDNLEAFRSRLAVILEPYVQLYISTYIFEVPRPGDLDDRETPLQRGKPIRSKETGEVFLKEYEQSINEQIMKNQADSFTGNFTQNNAVQIKKIIFEELMQYSNKIKSLHSLD